MKYDRVEAMQALCEVEKCLSGAYRTLILELVSRTIDRE